VSLLSPGRNIVLAGLMATGKTTVGRLLAARLQRTFADTDDLVERQVQMTVADYFAANGERAFRDMESAVIPRVAALRGQVIAVGGGAVLEPANVTQLRSTGDIVVLDGEPEVLADRITDIAARPLLRGEGTPVERLADLQAARGPAYERAAAYTVDTTDQTPEETVEAVLAWARTQPGLLSRDELRA
jgi:shikimate kinase